MLMRNQGEPHPLGAGAALVDITPESDIHLAGAVGLYRPAQSVLDPLFARALVLESGGRKVCFISLDLTIITEEWTARIREAAAKECGLNPDAVMVHVTQTHSAPSLGHFMFDRDLKTPPNLEWLRGGDPRYFEPAFERIVEAIRKAHAVLQPVRIGVGCGIEGRFAHNRRAVTKDGKVRMPSRKWQEPLGPTYIRYMEGPIDPEVGVFCVQSPSLRMVALLLHHTCHPVHGYPRRAVSADWPGAWAGLMQRTCGSQCVPLVLNGCCGNVNPWPPFDPRYADDHRRMGRALTETSLKVIETLTFRDEAALDWRVRHLKIPIREVEPALLREAQETLSKYPEPFWSETTPHQVDPAWMKAASVMSVHLMRERDRELDYEIQVLRVGQTAFVGLPGEPFVEGQLRIKLASPAQQTFVAHCTSHYVGYVPIREAFPRGGHEAETRFWSKLVPEALDMIVKETTDLLQEVFRA